MHSTGREVLNRALKFKLNNPRTVSWVFFGLQKFLSKTWWPTFKTLDSTKSLIGRSSVSSWCATESPGRTEPARTLLSSVSHSHEAFSSISWSSWRWAARPACSREQQTGGFMSRACWWNQAQAGSATFQTFRGTLSKTDLGTTIRQFYKCQ